LGASFKMIEWPSSIAKPYLGTASIYASNLFYCSGDCVTCNFGDASEARHKLHSTASIKIWRGANWSGEQKVRPDSGPNCPKAVSHLLTAAFVELRSYTLASFLPEIAGQTFRFRCGHRRSEDGDQDRTELSFMSFICRSYVIQQRLNFQRLRMPRRHRRCCKYGQAPEPTYRVSLRGHILTR
jgi:hypothetical protein